MSKQLDKNEKFYEKYLSEPDDDSHAVTTGLGLATFRVTNSKLLERLKELTNSEEVEAEFSFIRNKHLHYKPFDQTGVIGDGILIVRGLRANGYSAIVQYVVHHSVFDSTVSITCFNHSTSLVTVNTSEDVDVKTTLETLANALAYLFK